MIEKHKEFLPVNIGKGYRSREFIEKEKQKANKHMKRCSGVLVMRKM